MDGFKLRNYFNAVDFLMIGYLFDTFILIFFLPSEAKFQPLLFRIFGFIVILTILYHNRKAPSKLASMIHFFYPILFLSYIYGETAVFNHIFFKDSLDYLLVHWENTLFGQQYALSFAQDFANPIFHELMYFSYFSYYLFVIGFAIIAYKSKQYIKEKTIFIVVSSFIIYYIFFIVFPSYGPQYYFIEEPMTIKRGIFSQVVHWVQLMGEAPTGAFPSSHVGIMVIFSILAAKFFRKLLPITLVFTVLILFATVYIKAHYIIDVIFGIVSAPLLFWLSSKIYKMTQNILDEEWSFGNEE